MTDDARPSKTQRKKEMLALQDLGAELAALKESELEAIVLPDALREALAEMKRITGFEARRRQLQYIGRLMRTVDPLPIRERLGSRQAAARADTARLHHAERWRARLLDEKAALAEFLEQHPRADAQQLRALVETAQRERAGGRPPRSYRALFRLLRDTLAGTDSGS